MMAQPAVVRGTGQLLDRGQENQAQGEQLAQEQPAILTFALPHKSLPLGT
jgi:hypothetical protein